MVTKDLRDEFIFLIIYVALVIIYFSQVFTDGLELFEVLFLLLSLIPEIRDITFRISSNQGFYFVANKGNIIASLVITGFLLTILISFVSFFPESAFQNVVLIIILVLPDVRYMIDLLNTSEPKLVKRTW